MPTRTEPANGRRAALARALCALVEADADYSDAPEHVATGPLARAAEGVLDAMVWEALGAGDPLPVEEYARDFLADLADALDLDTDDGLGAILHAQRAPDVLGTPAVVSVGGIADALTVVLGVAEDGADALARRGAARSRDAAWIAQRARTITRERADLLGHVTGLLADLLGHERHYAATLAGLALTGDADARAMFAEVVESPDVDHYARRIARLVLGLCAALDAVTFAAVAALSDALADLLAQLVIVEAEHVTTTHALHKLTGSLDRNAPPAARVGVCATRAKRNARHASTRRREHSAAP